MVDYVPPTVNAGAFHCPHCSSFSDQFWIVLRYNLAGSHQANNEFMIGCCRRCNQLTIWKKTQMMYPTTGNAPSPNSDMPDDIKIDYNEARDIVTRSPRSACVLLRLCIEKICNEQKATGKDLSEKIGKLVEIGLDPKIQKALDSVRVIGGQAVHPLEMDLTDDVGTATSLFKLVNYISEWAHTRSKTIDSIFETLPDGKKKAIEKRDGSF